MLRGFATTTYWADDVTVAADWYAALLGSGPSFERPGPDGRPAYVAFRVGDHRAELGIADREDAPPGAIVEPSGAVVHWHVDDVEATLDRLLTMGARVYQPATARGDAGSVTASVVDPFGNVLGLVQDEDHRAGLPER